MLAKQFLICKIIQTKKILKKNIETVENKVSNISDLVTAAALNTKANKIENKIPNISEVLLCS